MATSKELMKELMLRLAVFNPTKSADFIQCCSLSESDGTAECQLSFFDPNEQLSEEEKERIAKIFENVKKDLEKIPPQGSII
jgi:hypothetical protein